MEKETRPDLRIDALFRNTNNWKNEDDVFNKMFKREEMD